MRQWLVLALALATASGLAGAVFASDDGGPPANAAATSLKLKQVTVDKRPVVDSAHWTITENSAKWDTSGFTGDYSWSLPSGVPAGGATGAIKVISTDKSGGRYNGVITASGSIVEGGSARAEALADKNGGQATVTKAVPFDLKPDACGSTCNVTVTVQDGPIVTFRYEPDEAATQPPLCGGSAQAFAAAKTCDLGSLPFGSEVSVPGPSGSKLVDVSPKPMPANAYEVFIALRELAFEEEEEDILAAIALESGVTRLKDAWEGCILIGEALGGKSEVRSESRGALNRACARLLKSELLRSAVGAAARDDCKPLFVPAFPEGRKVTRRMRKREISAFREQIAPSCERGRSGRLSFSIRARGRQAKLPGVTGRRIHVEVGRRGGEGTRDQRLGVRWRARKR